MQRRRFGRTELDMPVFSCGGMRYQHSWSDVAPEDVPAANQENLEACIRRAVELGINHIETARGYGTSEMQLGRILPAFPREDLIVQTKVGPKETAKEFLEVFEQSMANLKLDHVDLLGFHGINTMEILDQTVRKGGCLDVARRLQRDGRVRHLGFSTHAPLNVILAAIETGEFDYVNLHWYWVNQRNWPAVLAAKRHDMGVFIISPNDKGGKLYEPPAKLVECCRPLSPMIFNDLFCLLRPEVHTLSLGASKPSDFDEHIRALGHWNDAPSMIPGIQARLEKAMADTLGDDWFAQWEVGIPDAADLPGQVNVWEILRLQNFALGLDMVEFGKMRYNLLGEGGHWFPGTKAEEFDDDKLRTALAGSPFADEIPGRLRQAHDLLNDAPKKRLSSA